MPRVLLILWQVIAPIFFMMGAGFIVQRALGFDLRTLTRLNFWIFMPSFLFVKIVTSQLSGPAFLQVALHFLMLLGIMFLLSWYVGKLLGAGDKMRRALSATVISYNSGNYGVPAAQLAFPGSDIASSVQAVVMTMQNFTNFTFGLGLQASGAGKGKRETLGAILKLPMIYTLIAACLCRFFGVLPPAPIWQALEFTANGMVSVALVTLGAQMANLESYRFRREMVAALFLRLMLAPLVGFALVRVLGIHGELAKSLVVSTSFPVAVNVALLAMEFDNEPEFAAALVFYSTLVSTITVSMVIYAAQHWV